MIFVYEHLHGCGEFQNPQFSDTPGNDIRAPESAIPPYNDSIVFSVADLLIITNYLEERRRNAPEREHYTTEKRGVIGMVLNLHHMHIPS